MWRHPRLALVAILILAAALRVVAIDRYPPGLHPDEAVNAWNSWCLLKTGCDQFAVPWPIFYIRALGENRSALFCYVLLPFQALGGLNLWTLRLPGALGGVLTVFLIYCVGRRLFDQRVGLVAAALLAINPTHIQLTHWGHEASLVTLLTLAPFAALLWAGLPFDDAPSAPRPRRALLAGLLTGVCCYGYPAARLFLPAFLTAATLLTGRSWWRLARGGDGRDARSTHTTRPALLALVAGVAVTFGPLAYMHLTQPEVMNKRGDMTWIWQQDDPPTVRVAKVVERYLSHFGPDFLLKSGDADENIWAVPFGFLPGYYLPLLVAGLVVLGRQLRTSRAARVLLIGVVLYPVGDALNWHTSLHAMRSAAGLWPLVLLAAVGLVSAVRFLLSQPRQNGSPPRPRMPGSLIALGVTLAWCVVVQTARPLYAYFCQRPHQTLVYYGDHLDLLAACDWLRPRLDSADVVIFYPQGPNPGYTKYVVTAVALQHDPRRWLAEPREVDMSSYWDRYSRYGKFYFLFPTERDALLAQLRADGQPQRVIMILRPDDHVPQQPVARINDPTGAVALNIYELRIANSE